jgi:hypothetical protein
VAAFTVVKVVLSLESQQRQGLTTHTRDTGTEPHGRPLR